MFVENTIGERFLGSPGRVPQRDGPTHALLECPGNLADLSVVHVLDAQILARNRARHRIGGPSPVASSAPPVFQ